MGLSQTKPGLNVYSSLRLWCEREDRQVNTWQPGSDLRMQWLRPDVYVYVCVRVCVCVCPLAALPEKRWCEWRLQDALLQFKWVCCTKGRLGDDAC
jgi:hypothetical protein